MVVALVTGSAGLIGSETVRFFSDKGFDIAGIDNNMRMHFFTGDSPFFSIGVGSFIIGLTLVIMLLLVSKYDYVILQKFEGRFKFLRKTLPLLKEKVSNICRNLHAILLCFVLPVPVWFFEIGSIFCATKAIYFNIGFSLATLAGISAFVAQSLPSTPPGIGVHEGSIAGVLLFFGIRVWGSQSL
jgi:uncharacterized membrane protein YbhN (UPF0104 family)